MRADQQYRAMKARQILDDEVLIAAFEELERKAYAKAVAVPFWQGRLGDRRRRRALERVRIINELRGELETVIMAGASAARPQSGVA